MKSIISITIMTINYVYNEFFNYLNLIINSDDYIIKLERQYHDVKVKYHGLFCARSCNIPVENCIIISKF